MESLYTDDLEMFHEFYFYYLLKRQEVKKEKFWPKNQCR